VTAPSPPALVGRLRERAAIATALAALRTRPGGVVAFDGEPGIGKSRLLAHLVAVATADGCTVLQARASQFEADLPYGLFTEALDRHLAAMGDRVLSRLGLVDASALSTLAPALGELAAGGAPPDRHRTHRALRDLLERLACRGPLVMCLDDVHWADPASCEALAALVRRPPAGAVLFAFAGRHGQLPAVLSAALGGALREQRATVLALQPLSQREAAELVGDRAAKLYRQAGGNPFYLEQLARMPSLPRAETDDAGDGSVPPVVASALAGELAVLTPQARLVLDAAAVCGDPFDPALAADVAGLSEAEALAALDELLARMLVRPADVPRRFAFRHPVVRHAVYVGTPGGWRLGAHDRAARALARAGAGPVQRAHHVEYAAHSGDSAAIALLLAAADELASPAPARAARYYAGALRLLPAGDAPPVTARAIQARLADALAAAGDPVGARAALLDALATAADDERLALTVALANQEWWLGGHEDARRRLYVALGDLPAHPSADRIRLRLALGLVALMACDLDDACAHASDACDDARAIGDRVFEAAALAAGALAAVSKADDPTAADRLHTAADALQRLTPRQLATRLPALWMHGRAHRGLGNFHDAIADLERGRTHAAQTGRERILLVLTVESVATLTQLGRIADATAAGEESVERARLASNPRLLLWAHSALADARLAAGDVAGALRAADDAAQIHARPDFHAAGQPGWCLGSALVAAGNPERAVPAFLAAFGGVALAGLLPVDRPAAAADLVEAQLACGDLAAAEQALAAGQRAAVRAGSPLAEAIIAIARAAILLARDRPREAARAAMAAREAAAAAPLTHARAWLAEGRALAAVGDRPAAKLALLEAESQFDGFGALRHRDAAARELRRLGHRVLRPAAAATDGPLAALTGREQEIAGLVAAGRTNREVAEQLVLSTRTIEAHLRNIYAKLGVRSRVELTRAVAPAPDPSR
jgi:DNA-binding CsgD family transcriptional regulator